MLKQEQLQLADASFRDVARVLTRLLFSAPRLLLLLKLIQVKASEYLRIMVFLPQKRSWE